MKVKIYQLTDEAFDKVDYVFRDWETAKDKFNIKDYEIVYEYDICTMPSIDYMESISPTMANRLLEKIFYRFNQERPEDFKGHSLSTSDVVSLDDKLFYCDSFGWEEIN